MSHMNCSGEILKLGFDNHGLNNDQYGHQRGRECNPLIQTCSSGQRERPKRRRFQRSSDGYLVSRIRKETRGKPRKK
jgi:hypothetical protein